MTKTLKILFLLIIQSHLTVTYGQDCVDCSVGSLSHCSEQRINQLLREIERKKLILELEIKASPFDLSDVDTNDYLSSLNVMRSCQTELGLRPSPCNLNFRFSDKNDSNFNFNHDISLSAVRDNSCVYRSSHIYVATNKRNIKLFQYLNGKWSIEQKEKCRSTIDNNINEHSRSYVFNNKGLLLVDFFLEAVEVNNPQRVIKDTLVSQNRGKQVQMPAGTKAEVLIEENITFKFSSGFSFVMAPSGEIIKSNILTLESMNNSCTTDYWRRSSSSKPYFYPKVELKQQASHLRLKTFRN